MSGTETTQFPSPLSPPKAASSELPKQYRPADHERRVWDKWMDEKAFHANPERVISGEAPPYCVLIPPPNVTAALHLGHALNNTLQDILIRVHRMRGFETLWMPGTDHAGIATQAVVEKRVWADEKKRRTDFTREAFIEKIKAFKDEYEATIINQLKKMGCSCDWDRQRFTMDDICAKAVREAFFRLFRDGLIYRGKRLVNWDPVLQTAVADDECFDAELDASFYYLRYPLVHPHGATTASERKHGHLPSLEAVAVTWSELALRGYPGAEEHPDDDSAWITVATTRPETYLADTAVALNPHDPRVKCLHDLCVKLPLVGRVIPIIQDDYVVLPKAMARTDDEANDPKAEFATGFLKVTPGHDANDYDLYQRHKERMDIFAGGPNAALINMMAPDGRVSDKHGWTDLGDAHLFVGKKMAEARKLVLKEFEARNLLQATRPYRHSIKHSDRSKAIIEPYLSDQWYVKVTDDRLAPAANRALVDEQRETLQKDAGQPARKRPVKGPGDGTMSFFPARYAKMFEQWHENIRDWCISRQLWWGHRIPVWTRRGVGKAEAETLGTGKWNDSHAAGHRISDGADTETIHICVLRPDDAVIQSLESQGFVQDSDILDTWFSSALWPMSTMGWPAPDQRTKGLLQAFNPTSSISTAREIITLWISRMTMFNRYLMPSDWSKSSPDARCANPDNGGRGHGSPPFKHVFIHAVIQDGEGRKMSKSLGNGVDPLDIIESHGADAMRFTLAQMTTQTQDVRCPVVKDSKTGKNTSPKFDIGRNFANKVWNAARFTMGMIGEGKGQGSGAVPLESLALPDRWMLSRLRAGIERIDSAIANYEFSEYALALYDLFWRDFCDCYLEAIKPTIAESPSQRAALVNILSAMLRLLHPVMPFMTEAVWEQVGALQPASIPGLHLERSRKGGLLCAAGWPTAAPSLHDAAAEEEFERIQGLAKAILQVRAGQNIAPKRKIILHVPPPHLAFVRQHELLFATLGTVASMTTDAAGPQGSSSFTFEAQPYALSDLFDAAGEGEAAGEGGGAGVGEAELALLAKRRSDLEKEITTYEGRLANPGYAVKAPPAMVKETHDKLAKAREEHAAVLKRLG